MQMPLSDCVKKREPAINFKLHHYLVTSHPAKNIE